MVKVAPPKKRVETVSESLDGCPSSVLAPARHMLTPMPSPSLNQSEAPTHGAR